MSEENVEIVRTMIDTWEEQGFDATITAFDPMSKSWTFRARWA